MREQEPTSGELLQRTLDMLILKTLIRGPMHGYAVVEFIHQTSEEVLRGEEGAGRGVRGQVASLRARPPVTRVAISGPRRGRLWRCSSAPQFLLPPHICSPRSTFPPLPPPLP